VAKAQAGRPTGIKKGSVHEVDEKFAERMIVCQFAKKSTKKELEAFKKSIKDKEQARLKALEEIQAEARKAKEKARLEAKPKEKDCGCGGKVEDCEECSEEK
jgi:transposase